MTHQTTMPPCSACHAPYERHLNGQCPYTPTRYKDGWGHSIGVGVLIAILIFIALLIAGPIIYHTWYVDTHCTMVLGTQVCR